MKRKDKELKGQRVLPPYQNATTDDDILACFSNGRRWLSRRDIARGCFRAKSPNLIARINRMVQDGILEQGMKRAPNGVDVYYYALPERD